MSVPKIDLPHSSRAAFGQRPFLASHNLHEHELFSDEALIDLLDHFPREHICTR